MNAASTLVEKITEALNLCLQDRPDLFLVEIEVRGREGNRVLDIYLDGDDGLDVEDCADVSNDLSEILETSDLIPGHYVLNVSSPGAGRPLSMARQYPKHVGRDLEVTLVSGEPSKTIKGRLTDATDEQLTLQPKKSEPITVPFSNIQHAKVLLPW